MLKDKLVQAVAIVKKHVDRLKLNLSDKSTVVPISVATLAAARDLDKLGVKLKVRASCDDVGVQMGGGKRRQGKTQNNRSSKAKKRARRTRAMVLRNRKALKLVMTGVATQQAYGHVVNGATKRKCTTTELI